MEAFGPLSATWTARYESKHRDFKNFSESAKNFKNLLKTLAVKNQKKLASRIKHGLFSTPAFVFPDRSSQTDNQEVSMFSPLLRVGDQLYEKVRIRGTEYMVNYIVITKVLSADVLEVGTILKAVLKKTSVLFLVEVSDAARTGLGFFETLPSNTVHLIDHQELADFKPIIKRGANKCFPFVLHHHIPTPV